MNRGEERRIEQSEWSRVTRKKLQAAVEQIKERKEEV